jgi:uncharacterized protein YijF (DUF1287 family)
MKTPSVFRRVSANVCWLALAAATVWHLRFYVSSAAGQEQPAAKQTLAEQSRAKLPQDKKFATRLAHAALDRTKHEVRYDPAYLNIPYPGGDVPVNTGVCTDEIVRAYRALGYDLQRLVHEDMKQNFSAYPSDWGLKKPDKNIDHRRVLNLQVYFKRRGAQVPVTDKPTSYRPGDLITCTVPPNLPHIALVVPAPDGGERPWIVHNIGRGPQLEDRLFEFPLTGHYRWHPGDAE